MSNKCMEFPGNLRRALTLSYDDGVEQDIRLIDIMNRHGLKGTFNLNSGLYAAEGTVYPKGHVHRRLSRSQVTEVYGRSGQEVAIHCYTHADLAQQSPENVAWEVMKDKETLEEQFGRDWPQTTGIAAEGLVRFAMAALLEYLHDTQIKGVDRLKTVIT